MTLKDCATIRATISVLRCTKNLSICRVKGLSFSKDIVTDGVFWRMWFSVVLINFAFAWDMATLVYCPGIYMLGSCIFLVTLMRLAGEGGWSVLARNFCKFVRFWPLSGLSLSHLRSQKSLMLKLPSFGCLCKHQVHLILQWFLQKARTIA